MLRLGLLASGRGSNAEAILAAARDGRLDMDPAVLVCDRSGAAVLGVAARYDVPAIVLERSAFGTRAAQQEAIRDALEEHGVDRVALAGYAAILGPVVVDAYPDRIFNIHPSLLPAFAGSVAPEPQRQALEAGIPVSGCTVHVVTNEVDAGPIIGQTEVPVAADDTVETLSARILAAEHELYPAVLQQVAEAVADSSR